MDSFDLSFVKLKYVKSFTEPNHVKASWSSTISKLNGAQLCQCFVELNYVKVSWSSTMSKLDGAQLGKDLAI
jgi:hypothetical protein